MNRPYSKADHEAYRAEVEAEAAREEQARRDATREAARRQWIKDGGNPQSFDKAYDELADALAADEARQRRDAALATHRAGVSRI